MGNLQLQILESPRQLPVGGTFDVIVSGGGPAGFAAALSAARNGANTLLLEQNQCVGGIWTAGLMPWILDHQNKTGIMAELRQILLTRGGQLTCNQTLTAPPETIKFTLEELLLTAGVNLRYHTRVVAVQCANRELKYAITESPSGREAWQAKVFIDATGNGDLAAQAGCQFEYANAQHQAQPGSLIALLTGLNPDDVAEFSVDRNGQAAKQRLRGLLQQHGATPSYAHPSLFHFGQGIFGLMAQHAYGVCGFDADALTQAVLVARREIWLLVAALRRCGGVWSQIALAGTAEQLGIREGRRIKGLESITWSTITGQRSVERPIGTVAFGVDIHSPDPQQNQAIAPVANRAAVRSYSIPYGALVSCDRTNLLLAGRCISGDFIAHSSYRVTGDAVPMGETAGFAAAQAVCHAIPVAQVADLPFLSI